jgi:glycosyltransferase involved in cell wall biosynthesis
MAEPIPPRRDVVWLYDSDHQKHPFIAAAIETLVDFGCAVTVIDARGAPASANYCGIAAFRHSKSENWQRMRMRQSQLQLQKMLTKRELSNTARGSHAKSETDGVFTHRLRHLRHQLLKLKLVAFDLLRVWVAWRATVRRDTIDAWVPYIKAFRRILTVKGDVIVGTNPAAALLGFVAARLRRKRFVYYPFELYGCQHSPSSRLIAKLERIMLRAGVDALITQNAERAKVYRDRGLRTDPIVVRNYKRFRPPAQRLLRQALGIGTDNKVVLYEGRLNPGRWLERLVQASLLLPNDTLLVFMGHQTSWWKRNAESFAAAARDAGRLRIHAAVPHDSVIDYIADADAGVIIYDDTVLNNYLCAPGKLSDYVFAGVPIVAPNFPTIGPEVEASQIGVSFSDYSPAGIADAICRVLAPGREYWRGPLERAASRFVWSSQEQQLVAAILGCQVSERFTLPAT